jgi:hypothetical protein
MVSGPALPIAVFAKISISAVQGDRVECVDIPHGQAVDGTVIIVHCNGRASEKWTLANDQIVGIGGKCLDVAGGQSPGSRNIDHFKFLVIPQPAVVYPIAGSAFQRQPGSQSR